jgi:hypothetical protein
MRAAAETERHAGLVPEADARVRRQRDLVHRLADAGADTRLAEGILRAFERSLAARREWLAINEKLSRTFGPKG